MNLSELRGISLLQNTFENLNDLFVLSTIGSNESIGLLQGKKLRFSWQWCDLDKAIY